MGVGGPISFLVQKRNNLKTPIENKDHKNHENGNGWNRADTCMTAAIIHESLTLTGNVVIAQEMAMILFDVG